MFITINFESDVPIYVQLKNQIIEGIAKGKLLNEESLPSVRQMAEDIGINLHTVNKAYNLLKDDGFVTMDRRKGAVININSNMMTESYLKSLNENINPIIAEAYCRGMDKKEFLNICEAMFNKYSEGEKNE